MKEDKISALGGGSMIFKEVDTTTHKRMKNMIVIINHWRRWGGGGAAHKGAMHAPSQLIGE